MGSFGFISRAAENSASSHTAHSDPVRVPKSGLDSFLFKKRSGNSLLQHGSFQRQSPSPARPRSELQLLPAWESGPGIVWELFGSSQPELPHPKTNISVDPYPEHIPPTPNQHPQPDKAQYFQLLTGTWKGFGAWKGIGARGICLSSSVSCCRGAGCAHFPGKQPQNPSTKPQPAAFPPFLSLQLLYSQNLGAV